MHNKFASAEGTQDMQAEGTAGLKRKLFHLFMVHFMALSVTRTTKHGNTSNLSLVMFGVVLKNGC
jgi:hypothetical protein